MARAFKPSDIEGIVKIIQAWPDDRISWAHICNASKRVLGFEPTRQALNNFEKITEAYADKKVQLKNPVAKTKLPASLAAAAIRLQAMRNEIDGLKNENTRLRDLIDVVLYNAYSRGMKEHDMLADLPRVNRERHDRTPPTSGLRKL